jgi:hypothetical protein
MIICQPDLVVFSLLVLSLPHLVFFSLFVLLVLSLPHLVNLIQRENTSDFILYI